MSYNKVNNADEINSPTHKDSEVIDKLQQPEDEAKPIFDNNVSQLMKDISLENINHLETLQKLDQKISKKIDLLEALDLNQQIIDYKLYYTHYQFKEKIDQIKEERQEILESLKDNSKLSLMLNDIDKKILDLQNDDDMQKGYLNKLKISNQEEMEQLILQLEEDTIAMEKQFQHYESIILLAEKNRSKFFLLSVDAVIERDKLQCHLKDYLKYRIAGWKLESSEIKLTETLNSIGLKFTPSNRLLTESGSLLSFEEAQQKGYFENLEDTALQKLKKFLQGQDHIDYVNATENTQSTHNEKRLNTSQLTSEDVKYLKIHVGKALTLGVAEIVTRQPKDPIHYLAHYLFKYRYNQELDEIEKKEVDKLTKKRESSIKKRWNEFIQDEVRNVVVDMIIKAEELAYKNELQRIEKEQTSTAEEENT